MKKTLVILAVFAIGFVTSAQASPSCTRSASGPGLLDNSNQTNTTQALNAKSRRGNK